MTFLMAREDDTRNREITNTQDQGSRCMMDSFHFPGLEIGASRIKARCIKISSTQDATTTVGRLRKNGGIGMNAGASTATNRAT